MYVYSVCVFLYLTLAFTVHFSFTHIHSSRFLSLSSGGTTYVVNGNGLHRAQIRHLVFYHVPNSYQSSEDPTVPITDGDRPPGGSPEGSNKVPVPSLRRGPVTQCGETWDFISEV